MVILVQYVNIPIEGYNIGQNMWQKKFSSKVSIGCPTSFHFNVEMNHQVSVTVKMSTTLR